MTVVRVKPEMIREWRNTYKTQVIPGYKRRGVPSFAVWRTTPFGENYEFLLVSRMANLGQGGYALDSGSPYRLWFGLATGRVDNPLVRDGIHRHGLLHEPEEEFAPTF